MSKGRYFYYVVSVYEGEQGHIGGGDYQQHAGPFIEPWPAFQWIKDNKKSLDYRSVRVEVRE